MMTTAELFCHFLKILYWKYKSIKKKNKSEKLNMTIHIYVDHI